jgi:hypothetical protein
MKEALHTAGRYSTLGVHSMSTPATLPAPAIHTSASPSTTWQREQQAFQQLLPELLVTHKGRYVAVHNGKVVDSGDDKLALAMRVLAKVGNIPIYVGLVTGESEPVYRSGVRRELRPNGGGA